MASTSQQSLHSSHAPSTEKPAALNQLAANDADQRRRKRRRNIWIGAAVATVVVILAVVIPVAVVLSNNSSSSSGNGNSSSGSSDPDSPKSSDSGIPQWAVGGYLDVNTWYDTKDFNTTFTDEKVGGLYLMGLNSTWDDSARANPNVPPLDEEWQYGTMPFRGVNIGGWFNLEAFISPDLFDYPQSAGIVDEWSLTAHLGPEKAKKVLEKHYSEFASEEDFAQIQNAGFDHVRFPFSYWTIKTYQGDPYVAEISFRYMLRAIEWARKYGLRVFLDLHGVPGSQNGWTHSGHLGSIDWLKGPDGKLNGDRTLDITDMITKFFSQPRYKNVVTLYCLVNEPKMLAIGTQTVIDWYNKAIPIIRGNGYKGLMIIGDGFIGLDTWQGMMQGIEGLVIDIHQYIVYDNDLLSMPHADKIDYACTDWKQQALSSMDTATGFGPTMFGEFSYADTECAMYQNGVDVGSRWDGTYPGVPKPQCPLDDTSKCSCDLANANTTAYSDEYKLWMRTYTEAQMDSFENGWGWFHWTWKADNAPQWSYKAGLDAGFLPEKVYQRNWDCSIDIPDFAGAGLSEAY